jgi:hypothetical protein
MLRPVVWYKFTDTLEVLAASIIGAIALMMEAASNVGNFYQTILRNIPEDSHLHTRHHEDLKSHKMEYAVLFLNGFMKKTSKFK